MDSLITMVIIYLNIPSSTAVALRVAHFQLQATRPRQPNVCFTSRDRGCFVVQATRGQTEVLFGYIEVFHDGFFTLPTRMVGSGKYWVGIS